MIKKKNKKIIGPRTEPWGTPQETVNSSDSIPLMVTTVYVMLSMIRTSSKEYQLFYNAIAYQLIYQNLPYQML